MSISKNSQNMQLFAFYLGGSHPQSNIELHNLQFAIGEKIEDCYDQLKKDWFGDLKGLHIDSYVLLDSVDGYQITISKESLEVQNPDMKLFCVHLGAKVEGVLEEQHTAQFTVAKTAGEALLKIQKSLNKAGWEDIHRDKLFEVENIINLSEKYHLQITKSQSNQSYSIINFYQKI